MSDVLDRFPAPWTHKMSSCYLDSIYAANGGMVLGGVEMDTACAKLCAAAPELLAALRDCVAVLGPHNTVQPFYAARQKAEAAIAKATGNV